MNLLAFLKSIKAAGVEVALQGNNIEIGYDGEQLPEGILMEIKLHKAEIIDLLRQLESDREKTTSIPAAGIQPQYPASSSQKRLWLLSQHEQASAAYHMYGSYEFNGELNVAALESAFQLLIQRHEILRTVLRADNDGALHQVVRTVSEIGFKMEVTDLMGQENIEEKVRQAVQAGTQAPFDLSAGPLLRSQLFRLDTNSYSLHYVIHHIITDGWSMKIILNELLALYNAYDQKKEDPLKPLRIQYKDYAAWQQNRLASGALTSHKNYWLRQFDGELPVLQMPGDHVRPALKSYNGAHERKLMDKSILEGIKELSQRQDGTLFMGLLAGVYALLYRYTDQQDIIVGTPIAGREHIDLENQIGFYVGTLALRTRFNGHHNYLDLLDQVKETTLAAYAHQDYPFDELVSELDIKRDASRSALFDIMVSLQIKGSVGGAQAEQSLGTVSSRRTSDHGQAVISKFDLVFDFIETGDGLALILEYNTDLYTAPTMARLAGHLETLLASVVSKPSAPLYALPMLSDAEKLQLITEFNNTAHDYPSEKTVQRLFEEQVKNTPDHIAVVCDDRQLTYKELNEWSNRLAAYLVKKHKVAAGDLIATKLKRSEWLIISMMAIAKAGGVYVPLDTDHPQERIDYILNDSGCRVMIDEALLDTFKASKNSGKDPKPVTQPNDLAYVIYTSGSTGQPKGVMIEQRSLINLCNWHNSYYKVSSSDRAAVYAAVGFDASVWEIFPYLLAGACLYIVPEALRLDIPALSEFYNSNGISISFLTTRIGELFMETNNSSLRCLLIGGDRLNTFTSKNYEVINNYGPTETTVIASCWKADSHSKISIGKPIHNTQVYILDAQKQLRPVGVTGEIYIGGAGLARGYLNNARLTADKFTLNPFDPVEYLYHTGDTGRWLPDGNIEFIGRSDDQVKLRGYRIELGEIENILQEHADVETAVVNIRPVNQSGDKELVAYVVALKPLSGSDLRDYLKKRMPAYMIPAHFVQLPQLPLTPNGKINKAALPDPQGIELAAGTAYVAPTTEPARHLVAVYEDVLKKQPIGMKDDFFALGGDSIKSIQIVSRLRQRGYTLKIQDILLNPVVEDLAPHIRTASRNIDQGLVEGQIPLSPIQAYFFEMDVPSKHHFNQSVLLYRKEISESDLKKALDALVLHHDALRMIYRQTAQGWEQFNGGATHSYGFEIIHDAGQEAFAMHCDQVQSNINLATGPLFKACLFKHPQGDQLLLVAHHLVVDGVSWRIILEDLSNLYQQSEVGQQLQLPLKTDSFMHWQQTQLAYATHKALINEEAYWQGIESVLVPALIPDHTKASNLAKDVARRSFSLSADVTQALLTQCYAAYRTEINDILITALTLSMREQFGTDKLLLKLEGHGREDLGSDTDVSHTVGWFTTAYPVLIDAQHSGNSIRQLIEVKETLHRIPNKGIGYGILRYLANKNYRLEPQVTFNYLGSFGSGAQSSQSDAVFEFSGGYQGRNSSDDMPRNSLFDISGIETGGIVTITLAYSGKQYNESTIQQLMASFEKHLLDLVGRLSAEEGSHVTPVDLGYKKLSIERLNALKAEHDIEDIYTLSPLQQGLYYHWLSAPHSLSYFEQTSYSINGKPDAELLKKSYDLLVARHAVLRTHFLMHNTEELLQVVKRSVASSFIEIDKSNAEFSLDDYKRSDRRKGFDLNSGSQMRLALINCGNNHYELVWSYHHILMDGWCAGVLIKEFFELYSSLLQHREPLLGKVNPYSNYIEWLGKNDHASALRYWKDYLSGYDTASTFIKTAAAKKRDYQLKESKFTLPDNLRQAVKAFCRECGVTENTFFQAVWGILLGCYNSTSDVAFGAVVSGRPAGLEGIEEMIGLFINCIPVRISMNKAGTLKDLVGDIHRRAIESADHHYVQLAEIQAQSELGRGLFDHIMIFENYPVPEAVVKNAEDQRQSGQSELSLSASGSFEQTNYDLMIMIVPAEKISIKFSYNANVYAGDLFERLQDQLLRIITQVTAHPGCAIGQLDHLGSNERTLLLETFNATHTEFPKHKTIDILFEEQAEKTPGGNAVIFHDRILSYRELNEKANQLAVYLQKEHQLGTGHIAAIQLARSEWMIISLLAVLKTGAAYMPADAAYPAERIHYMISNSNCRLVIDEQLLDRFKEEEGLPVSDLKKTHEAGDLAYVIYTSGSTGHPKGVMVGHRSVVNFITGMKQAIGIQSQDVFLSLTSLSFDIFVLESLYPLLNGAAVVIGADRLEASEIADLASRHQVSVMQLTPSRLQLMLSESRILDTVKLLLLGGEALSDHLLETVKETYTGRICNMYGPTETTVWSTVRDLTEANRVDIGKPVANTHIYITDSQLRIQPVGVAGELHIGGEGLALGYLNNPELTRERFIADPFHAGKLMYKTGDVARWLPDGNIEYLGRLDDQVKIRGYRIELGEIENVLRRHELVKEAAVSAKQNAAGDKNLAAYFTASEKIELSDLRAYLKTHLPDYMIPSFFVQLDALPLTSNGKLNKKALPNPEGMDLSLGVAYVAPRNETEKKLAQLWQSVLDREHIGAKDDFFALGGHSLSATRLAGRIVKEFGVQVALKELFEATSLEDQASVISVMQWKQNSRSESTSVLEDSDIHSF